VGTVVFTKTVTLADGENIVQLDASVTTGTDFRMGINGNANLYRNSAGPSYPYTISNLMSITSSTASGVEFTYYYFFYDWEVREDGCSVVTSAEKTAKNVRIYPNPISKSDLSFEIAGVKNNESVNVKVYSTLGSLLYAKDLMLSQKQGKIKLEHLPAGNYLLQLQGETHLSVTKITITK
jgi:hypothetical protein